MISASSYKNWLDRSGLQVRYPEHYKALLQWDRVHKSSGDIKLSGVFKEVQRFVASARPGTVSLIQDRGQRQEWECFFKCVSSYLQDCQEAQRNVGSAADEQVV